MLLTIVIKLGRRERIAVLLEIASLKNARSGTSLFFVLLQTQVLTGTLYAQENPKPAMLAPFDTLLHTKIWPDIPEAEDFVKKSRPPEGSLQYQPLTRAGQDPARPKPKSPKELDAMEAELEHARDANAAKAGLKPFKLKPPAHPSHKSAQP